MNSTADYQTILLVEDDQRLSDLISEYLTKQGLLVEVEYRGDTAVQRILELQPDLVVLDLMLPGLDGLEVCRQVRPAYQSPILMLTARDEDVDQIVGLELGADDYVIKPVQPRILLARIRTLLRRVQSAQVTNGSSPLNRQGNLQRNTQGSNQLLDFDRLKINPAAREVTLDRQVIELTTQEYELLYLLANNAGVVLSRDQIFEAMSGIEYDGLDRSVDIRISRLRKLLENNSDKPSGIKTVRGQGYLFVAQGWIT